MRQRTEQPYDDMGVLQPFDASWLLGTMLPSSVSCSQVQETRHSASNGSQPPYLPERLMFLLVPSRQ